MDGVVHTLNPIYHDVQESAPVPDGTPVIDMARLNLDDPFERTVWRMVTKYRGKRQDYTPDGSSPWWNFDRTELQDDLPFNGAPLYEIGKKKARIQALRTRDTVVNESVGDSYEDIAVYGAIAYARFLYPGGFAIDV